MIKNIISLLGKIKKELKNFTDIGVIGLSGGADSTLVAVLCMLALGKKNVYGVHMPYSKEDYVNYNERSQKLAEYINIKHSFIPIGLGTFSLSENIRNSVIEEEINISDLNLGNMKARMRMLILYTINQALSEKYVDKKCRVIGTGNLSEDFIGYATKWGDLAVDINPIGELFKSEVYQLLDFFKDNIFDENMNAWMEIKNIPGAIGLIEEEHIDRIPSAGLWEGQTDEKELGYTYDEMEPAVKHLYEPDFDKTLQGTVVEFVEQRHWANEHKVERVPVINVRKFCD